VPVMDHWEYLVVEFSGKNWVDSRGNKGKRHKNDLAGQGDRLGTLGAEGWELTAITQENGYTRYRLYFRRRAAEGSKLTVPSDAAR
jgi:hypothetical protein